MPALPPPPILLSPRPEAVRRLLPLPGKHQWRALLKAAAAILTLGLIVFLKLDRVASHWYASHDDEPAPMVFPVPSPNSPAAAESRKAIDSLGIWDAHTFKPGELREFPDLNLRFRLPDDAWAFHPDPWSRDGIVFGLEKISVPGTRESIGEAWFSLRVLPASSEAAMDQNRAAAAVQASLRNVGGHHLAGREEIQINGLLFTRLEIEDLPLRHERSNAEVWVYAAGGIIYEMITAMPARTPPYYLNQTARRLAEGFGTIDPSKELRAADVLALLETAGAAPAPLDTIRHGNVALKLDPDVWTTWPGAQNTLPGHALAYASRSGLRIAAAFTPIAGLPDDPARSASLIGFIWPALRDFSWSRPLVQAHDNQRTAMVQGTGTLNSRSGHAEVRAVRCGDAMMLLFAYGPGDTKAETLTESLDHFKVDPGANGDPDFGLVEDRTLHRSALGTFAEDATASGRHAEASACYLALFEWDRRPDDLCLASRSLAAAGRKDEALQLIAANEGRHAGQPEWEAKKMLLLAGIGQHEESLRVAHGLLKTGGLAASMAAVYLETLIEARGFDEAQAFVKTLTSLDTSPVWHLYTALLMAETGERSKAAAVIRAARTAAPEDLELAVECVHVLMRCRLYPEALELARFLALKNPKREQTQLLAAACHTALGHTAEARAAYQNILKANPGSTVARQALESLAASSGQEGTEELAATTIPGVPLPAALAAKLPQPHAPLADPGGQSAVHLYRVTGIKMHPSIPLRQTIRGAIRILDEEGMSQFNTMRFPIHPQAQRLSIHHLRVLDVTGKVTAEASLSDHYTLDSASAGMATSGKVIHLPVPGLTPGCTIDYAYTIETIGSTGGIEYTRHSFALPEPCRLDAWFITGDTSQLKFATTRNLQPERDGDSLVWMETKPAILTAGLLNGSAAEELPVLHAGIPSASWSRLGRDYLDQIRDRLAPDPAVTQAANDTVAGILERDARVAALTALVRDSISYTAIEFGARAIIPNRAAATLTNRYGDCKDQSVLLHHLLSSASIPSHLCLINSRGGIQRDFPCLSQFDHMIVALPAPDGKSWDFIDPTNKYMRPVAGAAPLGLQARAALILDPKNPILAKTPAHTAASEIIAQRDLQIRGTEDAAIKDSITFTGSRAARLRAQLAPLQPLDRIAAIRQMIGFDRLSHQVCDVRIQNIKHLDAPLRIVIQWEALGTIRSEQGQLRLALPTVVESHLLSAGDEPEDASLPLAITAPLHVRSETTLRLPPGHSLSAQSFAPAGAQSSYGKWSLAVTPPGDSLAAILTWECSLQPATIPPAGRRPFLDFTHNSLRRLQGDWSFTADTVVRQ